MSAASRLKFLYLAYASQPRAERFLYRAVRRHRIARLVEFGVTSPVRSRRLIETAQRYAPGGKVAFTGIDLFESAGEAADPRPEKSRPLIEVFRALRPTGAALRLLPGNLGSVLADAANTLPSTDLLLIGHTVSDDDLARAWFYLPRMLHSGSQVWRERLHDARPETTLEAVPLAQIQQRAAQRHRPAA